jgi:hypothetical protein
MNKQKRLMIKERKSISHERNQQINIFFLKRNNQYKNKDTENSLVIVSDLHHLHMVSYSLAS